MKDPHQYKVYAIRYGHFERRSPENFLGGDTHDVPMPLDYFVWAIVGQERTFIVDTGFDKPTGDRRGRSVVRPADGGLAMLGIDHRAVSDAIISHMHYDHCGNHHLFPNATFHLQDAEMEFATGRCMCHHAMRHPCEAEDVTKMVRRVFDGKVCFHDPESEIAPGITLHKVGGHSRGLQVVRVETENGALVLASDAAHFYANMEKEKPFPVFDRLSDVIMGVERMRRLASAPRLIVPGHDPLVLQRFAGDKERPGIVDLTRPL